jgi:hypothetical protein
MTDFEQAAETCCQALDRLGPEDQRALLIRLLAAGALDAGDLGFIGQIAEAACDEAVALVRRRVAERPLN